MKYLQLFTNKYSLALLAILILALLCLMSTSEVTVVIILIKLLGFAMCYVYARLFKAWDKAGKIDCIKNLFNDED